MHPGIGITCRTVMTKLKSSDVKITRGSGNVFRDLGLPNADEKKMKVQLVVAIKNLIEARHLSQSEAAKLLGVNQPKISALANYRLSGFSIERLIGFLNALGCDVDIAIRLRRSSRKAGKLLVTAA